VFLQHADVDTTVAAGGVGVAVVIIASFNRINFGHPRVQDLAAAFASVCSGPL